MTQVFGRGQAVPRLAGETTNDMKTLIAPLLVLILGALPLAARADFYLNVKSLAQTAAVSGNGDCAGHHQHWRTTMTCGGAGSFDIDRWVSGGCGFGQKNCKPLVSWKCVLSVWKSGGPSSTTWHAAFSRNDSTACSMSWDNGNTLTVTVK
jgi:hypothetical protein